MQFEVQHPCKILPTSPERLRLHPNGALVWVFAMPGTPVFWHGFDCGGRYWALTPESTAECFPGKNERVWVCEHMGRLIE